MTDAHDGNAQDDAWDVAVVGGGLAGLTAAIFTARADLDTIVLNHGAPIVTRNAHLENFPGFPAGVNPRLLVEMIEDQAEQNGANLREAKVTRVERDGDGFALRNDGDTVHADRVVAASWSDASYLDPLAPETREEGSKTYLEPDEAGRTDVDGLYAAGRLAGQYHQAIVNAGHGGKVGVTILEDAEMSFYHDWTAPEGYFTLRGREVPKGCEEVPKAERYERERKSVEVMQNYFDEPHDAPVTPHPSLAEKDDFDP